LYLRLVVDGGKEIASVCTWLVSHATGHISFSLKEARYRQVKDYGRVLLNQGNRGKRKGPIGLRGALTPSVIEALLISGGRPDTPGRPNAYPPAL
jgi:hypothetical protein